MMYNKSRPNDKEFDVDRKDMVAKIESLGACSVVWFLTEILDNLDTDQLKECHNAIVNEFDLDMEVV